MVKVIKKIYRSDDGIVYTGYGLQSGKTIMEDISLSYKEAGELAALCNRLGVDDDRVREIAEDFVQR